MNYKEDNLFASCINFLFEDISDLTLFVFNLRRLHPEVRLGDNILIDGLFMLLTIMTVKIYAINSEFKDFNFQICKTWTFT